MNEPPVPAAVDRRYFEDYAAGTIFDCGSIAIEEKEKIGRASCRERV